jgi:hypothetical protein
MATTYALDPTGLLGANLVTGEQQVLTGSNNQNYYFIVPKASPFFGNTLSISFRGTNNQIRTLVEGIDYYLGFEFIGATRACGKPIYGGICWMDLTLTGTVTLRYQTLGGEWTVDTSAINTVLSDTLRNPRTASWEQVFNVPKLFPPIDHAWDLVDMVGMSDVVSSLDEIATAIANSTAAPAKVYGLYTNKEQAGVGNLDNFKTATDQESVQGVSPSRYMTPRAVKLYVDNALATFIDTNLKKYKSGGMPTAGVWRAGDYVHNTLPSIQYWMGAPAAMTGVKYIVKGWYRLTSGAGNTLNRDWYEDNLIVRDF